MNREDFPMLDNNVIYFDNGATTFKPKCVLDSIVSYYSNYTSNAHRGDYNTSLIVDTKYEETRNKAMTFINAKRVEEIIFTSGTTESLNMIINGYFKEHLKDDDEVLITKVEHASNILPWFNIIDNIRYIELDNGLVTLDNVIKAITPNTKVIALAHVTNTLGDTRPLKEIIEYAHKHNILVVIDAAQSVPHMKVDVQELDIDFLAFSAHKMCGPTGVGILYAKYELLDKLTPQNYGGGMNISFDCDTNFRCKSLPHRLEAGTPNIEGVLAFGSSIDYLNNIGIDTINNYVLDLRRYAISKLSTLNNIDIYNKDIESTTILFNVKGVFSQDTAVYLNKYNICVRAGDHCAKLLKEEIHTTNTCRISLYLYNTKEEIDKLVEVLNNNNILSESI